MKSNATTAVAAAAANQRVAKNPVKPGKTQRQPDQSRCQTR